MAVAVGVAVVVWVAVGVGVVVWVAVGVGVGRGVVVGVGVLVAVVVVVGDGGGVAGVVAGVVGVGVAVGVAVVKRSPLPPRKTPLPRSSSPIARSRIKRKPRPASETERAYGPPPRREWMTRFPCLTCGHPPKSQQSHLRSRSGAGRKGDASTVVPMCAECHLLYPKRSAWATRVPAWPDARLEAAAARFNSAWEKYGPRGFVVTGGLGSLYWGGTDA